MKRLAMALLLCAWSGGALLAQSGSLRAGAAQRNITPPVGSVPVGEWNPSPSKNIHDDLWARCLALDDGKTRIALVVCDLLGISAGASREARKLVEAECALPAGNVLISCTHTHSAASAIGDRYDLSDPPELTEYQQLVVRRIADVVHCALHNLEPAQIGWSTAQAPEHVFNRRWYLKPGAMPMNPFGKTTDKVKMNPGRGNPNLVKPAGPVDPQIYLMAVRRPDGSPIATFANYALHYIGGKPATDISADYYGMYNDRVQELLQADRQEPPFVSIMSNGTSGDINNVDVQNKSSKKWRPYEKMRYVANDVAQKVVAAYRQIEWQDGATLGAAFEEIELAFRHPTAEELAYGQKIVAERDPAVKPTKLPDIYAYRILGQAEMPKTHRFPIQAFRIGEIGIATYPVEVLVEIGLEMKKKIPYKAGFVVSLAHGYFGYMPPPEQIELGGYETWIGTNRLEPQAAPKMSAKLLEMLTAMQ